jgi:PilZ domain
MKKPGRLTAQLEPSSEDAGCSPADRRRGGRRQLPFGRGAVLVTAHSSHIVGLVDLSEGGAYLASRAPVAPGQRIALELLLTLGVAVVLPAEVVRVATRRESPDGYPPGIAIRFLEMEAGMGARLARFVEEGRRREGR